MKQINVTERNRTDSVAVICAFEGQEAWFDSTVTRGQAARAPGAPCKFVGELERDFERGRTVIAEKNFVQQVGRGC